MKQRKMKAERWVDAFLQHSWKTRLFWSEWRAADDESSLERKAEAWKEKTRTGNEVKMATDRKEELLQKSSNLGWKNLIRKWRELTRFFVRANATAPCCITFSLQWRAPPFLVRASGAVALKVAEVSSTEKNAKNLVTLPLLKKLTVSTRAVFLLMRSLTPLFETALWMLIGPE